MLGNVSNPLINRWGSNLIWYNFWYSDNNYGKQVQQDRIFVKLLETYLTYGLENSQHRFSNKYWYRNKPKAVPVAAYYRYFIIDCLEVKFIIRLRLRCSMTDFYRMRVWILRYDRWLLINMYWFHPNKKKITLSTLQNKVEHDYLSTQPSFKTTAYRRFFTLHRLIDTRVLLEATNPAFYIF